MTTIAERMQAVKASIEAAAIACGRQPDTVQLLAVSKAHPAEKIRESHAAGQWLFGENYLQEALDKQAQLPDLDLQWHFIGPIQSNKTQAIARHFDWVHGVDRLKIAERLNNARVGLPPLQVCIQVNVSGEASKSGVEPAEVYPLAVGILQLPQLRLRGLMAIPAPTQDQAQQRSQFGLVRQTYIDLKQKLPQAAGMDTLSIGMSDDYAAAIAEGATIVRIGSAIFGARPGKNRETEQ